MRGLWGECHLSFSLNTACYYSFFLSRCLTHTSPHIDICCIPCNSLPITALSPCHKPNNIDKRAPKRAEHKGAEAASPLRQCQGRCSTDEVCNTTCPFHPVVSKGPSPVTVLGKFARLRPIKNVCPDTKTKEENMGDFWSQICDHNSDL